MTNVANFQILIFGVLVATAFAFAISAITFPPSFLKFFLGLLAFVFAVLAFSMRYYYYIFMPFVHMKNRTVVLDETEAFTVAPAGNAITRREGEYVYATTFVRIPVYTSSTEMGDDEKYNFSSLFSKIISMSQTPIKISTQLNILNKDNYINRVREKLNDAESRYNNTVNNKDAKPEEVERVKGEVTMWHNLLDNISNVDSFIPISYISVTAMGGNEEEAVNISIQKANEIVAGVSSTYGVIADIITTPELLTLIEPDYIIPFSTINRQIKGMI
ncbi:MAG: hypothetical protein ACP5RK_00380 [Candidatus Micrarchaeia archaeon]